MMSPEWYLEQHDCDWCWREDAPVPEETKRPYWNTVDSEDLPF